LHKNNNRVVEALCDARAVAKRGSALEQFSEWGDARSDEKMTAVASSVSHLQERAASQVTDERLGSAATYSTCFGASARFGYGDALAIQL
jgi:hypothetical protein